MNGRRGFLKSLVGAFVASAIDLRMAREPELAQVSFGPTAPTAVLTNAVLDRIYARLITGALPNSLDNTTPI